MLDKEAIDNRYRLFGVTFVFLDFSPQKRRFESGGLILRRGLLQHNRLGVCITPADAALFARRRSVELARSAIVTLGVSTRRSI